MRNQKQAAGTASALLGLLQFISGALVAPLVGIGGSNTALPMGIVIALCEVEQCYVIYLWPEEVRNSLNCENKI